MQVNCVLQKGDRPVNFTWVFNDIVLQSGDGIQLDYIGKSSILTLDPVRGIHKGIYTCIASNRAGEEQVSATLVVNGIVVHSVYCHKAVNDQYLIIRHLWSLIVFDKGTWVAVWKGFPQVPIFRALRLLLWCTKFG